MVCPHCGIHAQVVFYTGNPMKSDGVKIGTCAQCSKPIYIVESAARGLLDYYPKRIPRADAAVPEKIASDFVEACKCLDVGAFRACATMCRRAVQTVALDQGGKGETLFKQVEDLAERHVITPALAEWAHQARAIGVAGAHADVPSDVNEEDAAAALKFTESLIEYVYVIPATIAARRGQTSAP
jgi:hypothetical protein